MQNEKWKFFVWGKHPALEDFVWAGTQTRLFQRFTKWVENGFTQIEQDSQIRIRNCTWRFWSKGTEQEIVCGLIRNSSDSQGRNYPLLYLGAGCLKDWSDNCSMLPIAFDAMWKSIEYISSARFDTLGQLNESLQLIESPTPDWRNYQQRIHNTPYKPTSKECVETVEDGKKLLRLDCKQSENLPHDICFCKNVMSMGLNNTPMAVFIGEINGDIGVAIIKNTLTPGDFIWLWNIDQNPSAWKYQEKTKG